MSKRMKYNFERLDKYCKENNVTLLEDYSSCQFTKDTYVKSKCSYENCENIVNKRFRQLEKSGSYCLNCIKIKSNYVRKKTCLNKYGIENAAKTTGVKNKIKNTCIKKYGVHYSFQSEKVKDKIKETMLKRYGVQNPNQYPEIFEKGAKNSFKTKKYLLPSGNLINYQGYENYALDELINLQINENDIINKRTDVPEIWFYYNDKYCRHYVDIYIKSQNKCIEVKSDWYFNKDNNKILEKQKTGKELGYNYEIWVYDKKGNKTCYN